MKNKKNIIDMQLTAIHRADREMEREYKGNGFHSHERVVPSKKAYKREKYRYVG